MANARAGNLPVNKHGGFAQTAITFHDKEKTCHGEVKDLIQGSWRKRNNDKPVTVVHKEVDTLACL